MLTPLLRKALAYFEANKTVKAMDLASLEGRLAVLEHRSYSCTCDTQGLKDEVRMLKAVVDKLSARLIGFSKTGIS